MSDPNIFKNFEKKITILKPSVFKVFNQTTIKYQGEKNEKKSSTGLFLNN